MYKKMKERKIFRNLLSVLLILLVIIIFSVDVKSEFIGASSSSASSNVGLYGGDVNLNIPLFSLNELESLPYSLSLTYNSDVYSTFHEDNFDGQASWAGLGWSVEAPYIHVDHGIDPADTNDDHIYINIPGVMSGKLNLVDRNTTPVGYVIYTYVSENDVFTKIKRTIVEEAEGQDSFEVRTIDGKIYSFDHTRRSILFTGELETSTPGGYVMSPGGMDYFSAMRWCYTEGYLPSNCITSNSQGDDIGGVIGLSSVWIFGLVDADQDGCFNDEGCGRYGGYDPSNWADAPVCESNGEYMHDCYGYCQGYNNHICGWLSPDGKWYRTTCVSQTHHALCYNPHQRNEKSSKTQYDTVHRTYRWDLSSISDISGNRVSFSYDDHEYGLDASANPDHNSYDKSYLKFISDSFGNNIRFNRESSSGSDLCDQLEGFNSSVFEDSSSPLYGHTRCDVHIGDESINGDSVANDVENQYLSSVELWKTDVGYTRYSSFPDKKYVFNYEYIGESPISAKLLLKNVSFMSYDGSARFPAYKFDYYDYSVNDYDNPGGLEGHLKQVDFPSGARDKYYYELKDYGANSTSPRVVMLDPEDIDARDAYFPHCGSYDNYGSLDPVGCINAGCEWDNWEGDGQGFGSCYFDKEKYKSYRVRRIVSWDGMSSWSDTNYYYENAVLHLEKKRKSSIGHDKVVVYSSGNHGNTSHVFCNDRTDSDCNLLYSCSSVHNGKGQLDGMEFKSFNNVGEESKKYVCLDLNSTDINTGDKSYDIQLLKETYDYEGLHQYAEYDYNPSNGMVNWTKICNSDGSCKISETTWCHEDYMCYGGNYNYIIDNHLLSLFYESSVSEGSSTLKANRLTYRMDNGVLRPHMSYSGDGGESQMMTKFDDYDRYGRVLQTSDANGQIISKNYYGRPGYYECQNAPPAYHPALLTCTEDREGNQVRMFYDDTHAVEKVVDSIGMVKSYERNWLGSITNISLSGNDNPSVRYEYDFSIMPRETVIKTYHTKDGSEYSEERRLMDGYGRYVQSQFVAGPGEVIFQDVEFDDIGNIKKRGELTLSEDKAGEEMKRIIPKVKSLFLGKEKVYNQILKSLEEKGEGKYYVEDVSSRRTDDDAVYMFYDENDPRNRLAKVFPLGEYSEGDEDKVCGSGAGEENCVSFNNSVCRGNYRCSEVRDAEGKVSTEVYDLFGNLVESINDDGDVESFEYDLLGRLVKAYDFLGRKVAENHFNSLGLLESTWRLDSGETSFTYTLTGKIKTVTHGDSGDVFENFYDNMERVVSVKLNGDLVVEYVYDSLGSTSRGPVFSKDDMRFDQEEYDEGWSECMNTTDYFNRTCEQICAARGQYASDNGCYDSRGMYGYGGTECWPGDDGPEYQCEDRQYYRIDSAIFPINVPLMNSFDTFRCCCEPQDSAVCTEDRTPIGRCSNESLGGIGNADGYIERSYCGSPGPNNILYPSCQGCGVVEPTFGNAYCVSSDGVTNLLPGGDGSYQGSMSRLIIPSEGGLLQYCLDSSTGDVTLPGECSDKFIDPLDSQGYSIGKGKPWKCSWSPSHGGSYFESCTSCGCEAFDESGMALMCQDDPSIPSNYGSCYPTHCEDGTPVGQCSYNVEYGKPWKCTTSGLVRDCGECSCPNGIGGAPPQFSCHTSGNCYYDICEDGTAEGECSGNYENNQPLSCSRELGMFEQGCDFCACGGDSSCAILGGYMPCPLSDQQTCVNLTFDHYAYDSSLLHSCVPAPCVDGTLALNCSDTKPLFCGSSGLEGGCTLCGCPDGGQGCNESTGFCTEGTPCEDGTTPNTCSSTEPLFCTLDGELVNDCDSCGCNFGAEEGFCSDFSGECFEYVDSSDDCGYGKGRLCKEINHLYDNEISYKYDFYGRTVEVKETVGGEEYLTDYSYYMDGSLKSVDRLFNNVKTSYYYNKLGNIESVELKEDGESVSFDYTPTGSVDFVDYPNGMVVDYNYNDLNLLRSIDLEEDSTQIFHESYGYNNAEKLINMSDIHGNSAEFEYDSMYRLTGILNSGNYYSGGDLGQLNSINYGYDLVGNRQRRIVSGTTDIVGSVDDYIYNYETDPDLNNNRLLESGDCSYDYDLKGNMISKDCEGEVSNYTYDANNMITRIVMPDFTVLSFRYDALGRRVYKQVTSIDESVTTTYLYGLGNSPLIDIVDYESEENSNLIKNPSFEIDFGKDYYPSWDGDDSVARNSVPDGWKISIGGSQNISMDSNEFFDGSNSLKLDTTASRSAFAGYDVPVILGKKYKISGYIKVDQECLDSPDCFGTIGFHCHNDEHLTADDMWDCPGDGEWHNINSLDWTYIQTSVIITHPDTKYLDVLCYHSPGTGAIGTVWCDDFSVREYSKPIDVEFMAEPTGPF